MAALCGQSVKVAAVPEAPRVPQFSSNLTDVRPNRNAAALAASPQRLLPWSQAHSSYWTMAQRLQFFGILAASAATVSIFWLMWQGPPAHAGGNNNMRLPPRWEPTMENHLPFRSWLQDLMLWTIVSDLAPHQQCAAIISQLGGAARDLARTLSPNEVYNGGIVNGVQLDPVSFLLHGLSSRFAPLDEESRLRAAQEILSFARRSNETVDTLISRFEITRQRAMNEGGGAVSIETAALLLLRACGVTAEQFQVLTQPFGLRLPTVDAEFQQMTHHLRRMGHIVERFPHNIASGLRSQASAHFVQESQAFMAEADTGSSASVANDQPRPPAAWGEGVPTVGWAFASEPQDGASDTDSNASSDNDEPLPMDGIQGMSAVEVDEYLFGQYQQAKKRWRRFTGKPVRSLRRVLKRKGKGKSRGKGFRSSFLNIDEVLQQSSYYKGKGKGGRSSGKGFGRRLNPTGRDGDPLKCSICGSMCHLRARCNQRQDAPASDSGTRDRNVSRTSQAPAPSFAVESGSLHFAAFEDVFVAASRDTPICCLLSHGKTYTGAAARQPSA